MFRQLWNAVSQDNTIVEINVWNIDRSVPEKEAKIYAFFRDNSDSKSLYGGHGKFSLINALSKTKFKNTCQRDIYILRLNIL